MPHMNLTTPSPIASGATADIYLANGKIAKVYKQDIPKNVMQHEADMLAQVESLPFRVPKSYGLQTTSRGLALVMEYIEGSSVGALIENGSTSLLDTSIRLQVRLNQTPYNLSVKLKDKLALAIQQANETDAAQKDCALQIVDRLQDAPLLCHGDFHVYNLIQTCGDIAIIDWLDASTGDPAADCCRTYMLYRLFAPHIAENYLDTYCAYTKHNPDDIRRLLPAVAAARFAEGNAPEYPQLHPMIQENI